MISMELQRDVPQYMAIPWLMTWVMARTVSVMREGEIAGGGVAGGLGPSLGTFCKCGRGARSRQRALRRCLASSVLPGSEVVRQGVTGMTGNSEPQTQEAGLENHFPE